ncbi:isochorismatase family protein [Microbulbifer sp. SSSA007]|uniref:isochorismatase family protein n=1 Tax=Microbulbifer TaxID=48073 RepID=UPI00036B59D8|nr:isochorismatase family protein [Microbulbifer variabilis]
MDVLLIIDMQEASFAERNQFDVDGTIARINRLAAWVRERDGSVIFIQHDGLEEEGLLPGSTGWALLDDLIKSESDLVIRKKTNDAFYQTDLKHTLEKLNVNRLIVSGWATDFCVDTTIRSAVSHKINILVASDCHTLKDRPHLKAQTVIAHHNWIWSELITDDTTIRVELLEEILQ